MTNSDRAMRAAEKILETMDIKDVDLYDVREVARTIAAEYADLSSEVEEWRRAFATFCGDPEQFLDCFHGVMGMAKDNRR